MQMGFVKQVENSILYTWIFNWPIGLFQSTNQLKLGCPRFQL